MSTTRTRLKIDHCKALRRIKDIAKWEFLSNLDRENLPCLDPNPVNDRIYWERVVSHLVVYAGEWMKDYAEPWEMRRGGIHMCLTGMEMES